MNYFSWEGLIIPIVCIFIAYLAGYNAGASAGKSRHEKNFVTREEIIRLIDEAVDKRLDNLKGEK